MQENSKPDSYFVELIQLLPVLLEFGDRKLYDTDKFAEYYPELLDEYEIKREDWNEAYYYAIENLLPDPVNQGYSNYIGQSIAMMVENDLDEYSSEDLEVTTTEGIIKEFHDKFNKIYSGIIKYFDELEKRLVSYGASEILPLLLNLYYNQYSIDIAAMRLLHKNARI